MTMAPARPASSTTAHGDPTSRGEAVVSPLRRGAFRSEDELGSSWPTLLPTPGCPFGITRESASRAASRISGRKLVDALIPSFPSRKSTTGRRHEFDLEEVALAQAAEFPGLCDPGDTVAVGVLKSFRTSGGKLSTGR